MRRQPQTPGIWANVIHMRPVQAAPGCGPPSNPELLAWPGLDQLFAAHVPNAHTPACVFPCADIQGCPLGVW